MGRVNRTEIDIETLLLWAFRDELAKRQTSAAEGLWDHIRDDGQTGTAIDRASGGAQRYAYIGLPDPDALLIERAVAGLENLVIDWAQSFEAIAAELSGLISVNDMSGDGWQEVPRTTNGRWGRAGDRALKAWFGRDSAEDPARHRERPRDVLMVGGINTAALVTMHAYMGTRPDWIEETPLPLRTPAKKGTNAAIFGECRGKNLYSLGAYCPLRWSPSPLSILDSRADYVAWHHGLTTLARTLQLGKFAPLPPRASQTPWRDTEPEKVVRPVVPTPTNGVDRWGTLPLSPHRGRSKGPPLRSAKGGPVSYPPREACS